MVVGIVGQTDLGRKEAQAWLRQTIRSWLARWDVRLGYTNLEPGAGMLFGEILYRASIPYRAILPSPHYESFFTFLPDLNPLLALVRHAAAVHCLDHPLDSVPSWLESRMHVIEQSDVVFCILSGIPASDGAFIAAQEYACKIECAVISLNLQERQGKVICKHNQW